MAERRVVPSSAWLVGGLLGVIVASTVVVGLRLRAAEVSVSVAELRQGYELAQTVAVLAALSMLALGVLVDAELFRRRDRPVGGIATDEGGWRRVVYALVWPAMVGAVLGWRFRTTATCGPVAWPRCGDPACPPPRPGEVSSSRASPWRSGSPCWLTGGARSVSPAFVVPDAATEREAAAWAATLGRSIDVRCNPNVLVRAGGSFSWSGLDLDLDTDEIVGVVGTVVDDSGRTTWVLER